MTKDTREGKEKMKKDTEIYREKYKKWRCNEDIQKRAAETRCEMETFNKPGN
jgi:hypothetical protein